MIPDMRIENPDSIAIIPPDQSSSEYQEQNSKAILTEYQNCFAVHEAWRQAVAKLKTLEKEEADQTSSEHESARNALDSAVAARNQMLAADTTRVLQVNQKGLEWFNDTDITPIWTEQEQRERVSNGTLVNVEEKLEDGFKIVATLNPEMRHLTPQTNELLRTLAKTWKEKIIMDLPTVQNPDGTLKYPAEKLEKMSLIVTSLTRSVERQRLLNNMEGVPAAAETDSVHTRGEAFDIGPEGFLRYNSPELLMALIEILQEWEKQGAIQPIYEYGILAVHITRNPHYELKNGKFKKVS